MAGFSYIQGKRGRELFALKSLTIEVTGTSPLSPLVTSGYRSQAVNSAVGGVPNSQHIAGEAADITVGSPEQNRRLLGLALAHPDKVTFDQIIAERCDRYGNPRWIHISYGARMRSQALFN